MVDQQTCVASNLDSSRTPLACMPASLPAQHITYTPPHQACSDPAATLSSADFAGQASFFSCCLNNITLSFIIGSASRQSFAWCRVPSSPSLRVTILIHSTPQKRESLLVFSSAVEPVQYGCLQGTLNCFLLRVKTQRAGWQEGSAHVRLPTRVYGESGNIFSGF